MNAKIKEHLKNIRIHANTLTEIPANEQNLGNIQIVIAVALREIEQCLEEMDAAIKWKEGQK